MPNCAAFCCENRSTNNKEVSFHRLPSQDNQSKQWLEHIKRKNAEDLVDLRICSVHFESDCFEEDIRAKITGTKGKPKLKPGSIPTIFAFKEQPVKRRLSEKRAVDSNKKQLISDAISTTPVERLNISCENNDTNSISHRTKTCSTQTDITISPHDTWPCICESSTPTEPTEIDADMAEMGEDELDQSYVLTMEDQLDQSYVLSSQSTEEENELNSECDFDSKYPLNDSKFIVFWPALLSLLTFCHTCREPAFITKVYKKGCAVVVILWCSSNHETLWSSMPKINGTFAANLLLPASIIFTGGTYLQFKDICDTFGLQFISKELFQRIQKQYVFPTIHKVYKTVQSVLIDKLSESGPLDVSGDARCDSPGYSAKYSTYSIMDGISNQVIHFYVTHVGTVENSSRMEKAGLIKVLDKLKILGITIQSLATDRHPQVRKYMRENRSDIDHQYDIWHFSKSIKKALLKAAKKKGCEIIHNWIKAIINHFWWCCANCQEDYINLREKWTSILFHITNKHKWAGYKQFKKCQHKRLTKKEVKHKLWIKEGTPAYCEIEKIIKKKKTLKDLCNCTKFKHSGNLEVYHSSYLKYCPKRLHFSFEGMIARSELAILHFNSVVTAPYAQSKLGKPIYKHQFSKVSGSWVIKRVKEKGNKLYLSELMKEIVWLKESGEEVLMPRIENIPKYIASVEKTNKQDSIANMKTRFT